MAKLPPATLRTLQALDAAPNKQMRWNDFLRATGVKTRARQLFYANLTNKGFVTTNLNYEYTVISLTFAGMQALKEHGNEL